MRTTRREDTAFHEAGHAVVFWLITGKPPTKVIVRWNGSGATYFHRYRVRPDEDLAISLAGFAAEIVLRSKRGHHVQKHVARFERSLHRHVPPAKLSRSKRYIEGDIEDAFSSTWKLTRERDIKIIIRQVETLIATLRKRTVWAWVERLAGELLKFGSLDDSGRYEQDLKVILDTRPKARITLVLAS